MSKKFKTQLDLMCSTDKDIPHLSYIYFKDGFIYVTNRYVALKQKIDLHGINKDEAEILNGRAIHKNLFKLINRQNDVEFRDDSTLQLDLGRMTFMLDNKNRIVTAACRLHGSLITFDIPKIEHVPGKGKILEQIDKSFATFKMNETKEIAINPEYIDLIRKVFVTSNDGFTFRFNENFGGVLVTPNKNNYREHAIIIPLRVTGEKNAKGI